MTGGEHFVGKYEMISQENLDEYLKEIGKIGQKFGRRTKNEYRVFANCYVNAPQQQVWASL